MQEILRGVCGMVSDAQIKDSNVRGKIQRIFFEKIGASNKIFRANFVLQTWVYRGTGVSRGVRRTTWERSLKNWELQISCFEEFLGGENVLGLVPASLPHTLGYACTFYAPTSPQIPGFLCCKFQGCSVCLSAANSRIFVLCAPKSAAMSRP